MSSSLRHGRLQRISRIAFFMTSLAAIAAGGVLILATLKKNQDESQIQLNENLKIQAQLLVDQFFIATEALRTLPESQVDSTNLPEVSHRASIKLTASQALEVEALDSIRGEAAADLGLEDRLLEAVKSQVRLADLKLGQTVFGVVGLSEVVNRNTVFAAVPVFASKSAGPKSLTGEKPVLEKIRILILDPDRISAPFTKLATANLISNSRRAFLIHQSGQVLAHSVSSYVGTELSKIPSLKNTLENLFIGARTGTLTRYESVEGSALQLALVRVGTLPLAIGVEQNTIPVIFSLAWIEKEMQSGAARRHFGTLLLVLAFGLTAVAGISVWVNRQFRNIEATKAERKPIQNEVSDEEARDEWRISKRLRTLDQSHLNRATSIQSAPMVSSPISTTPVPPAFRAPTKTFTPYEIDLDLSTTQFVEARGLKQVEQNVAEQHSVAIAEAVQPKSNTVQRFVDRIQNAKSLDLIEKELTETCSRLADSPVLYFRYHRRNQNLLLSTVAGSVQIANHSVMQVLVRKDIEKQIQRLGNEGRVSSVSNYAPLAKLMVNQLNVAHFEAWTVISDRSLHEEGSQLTGVLVVLHAGFRSAEARPILGKIIREAGNYLYAQTHKIRIGKTEASHSGPGPSPAV